MRYTIFKWIVLTALIAYTVGMAVWANTRADERRCIEIVVPGDTTLRSGIIAELAKYDKNLLGKPISKIDIRDIENHLMKINNFESVECAMTAEGRLFVDVMPMVPELRVFSGNDSYYINKDGKRIAANARFHKDVPVVCGNFTKDFGPKDLIPLVRYINSNALYREMFSMVKADSPNDVILIPRITGHVVNIGNTDDLDKKFRKIMIAYQKIIPHKGWNAYDTISVKFKGQIVATRRDKNVLNHTPEYEEEIDFDEDELMANEGTALARVRNDSTANAAPKPDEKTKTNSEKQNTEQKTDNKKKGTTT